MRVGLLTSTAGHSPLVHALERELKAETYYVGMACDLVLVCNQTAHTREYRYPDFPTDPGLPIAFIDSAEYGTSGRPFNAFSAPTHDTKNAVEQERLRRFLEPRSFPYFLREMWLDYDYPAHYFPIDYPLHHMSLPTRAPDRDQYEARPHSIACIWGQSNVMRGPIADELREVPLSDVYVLEKDGPRLPQAEYFRRLEAARCTVNADGYGSSSFRLTEALVRTVVLQVPLRIRQRAPLVPGETCYRYAVERVPDVEFEVFQRGYDHCMTHLTEAATAQYVLETAKRWM